MEPAMNFRSEFNPSPLKRVKPSSKKSRKKAKPQVAGIFENWSQVQLEKRASALGVEGWSKMTRKELIHALQQS